MGWRCGEPAGAVESAVAGDGSRRTLTGKSPCREANHDLNCGDGSGWRDRTRAAWDAAAHAPKEVLLGDALKEDPWGAVVVGFWPKNESGTRRMGVPSTTER
jgi:hypothetical protein